MRTQQRKFVVEIKSGRRQVKSIGKSIWGDTDFKALARQVEGDEPGLFRSNEVLEDASDALGDLQVSGVKETVQVIGDKYGLQEREAQAVAPIIGIEDVRPVVNSEASVAEQTADRKGGEVEIAAGADRPIDVDSFDNGSCTIARPDQSVVVSLKDIADLERENVRLKNLWATRLRNENSRLQTMIARFVQA
jgi:hypothetical protein